MAFCSACGGQITGPFCGRCGAPAAAAGPAAPAPPPQAPPPPPPPSYQAPPYQAAPPAQPYQAPPPQAPPYQGQPYQAQPHQAQPYPGQPMGVPPGPKKTSPIVWILLIVGGLFVVGVLGVIGLGMFALHKVKQAGLDPELMRNNPGLAISKLVTALNPDVQVLDTNDHEGTITVRDRKTGKVVKMSFDDVKNGHFNMRVQEDGKDATLEIGADVNSKLPSWVPAYTGANVRGGLATKATGQNGEEGNFTFTTSDSPETVRSFYEGKARDANMQVETAAAFSNGSVLTITDPGSRHTISVTIGGGNPTGVSVFYATK